MDCHRTSVLSVSSRNPAKPFLDSVRSPFHDHMLSLDTRNVSVQVNPASAAAPVEPIPPNVRPGNDRSAVGFRLGRSKSLFSFASMASEESSDVEAAGESHPDESLAPPVDGPMGGSPRSAHASSFRETMEPFLREARAARQRSHKCDIADVHMSIAGSVNVPYTALRHERPFLFDEHTYPLHEALAESLRVENLLNLQRVPEKELLQPLLDPEQRHVFHAAYESFVTSFILPLCHSLAIAKNVLHVYSSDKIHYRYQAFPNIHIVRPGDKASRPTCGLSEGYSIASLQFHVPLTPAVGSNAVCTETYPGREDWHALHAKSFGLGYMFDGTRCLHFDMGNNTDCSRVYMDFRVVIYREGSCQKQILPDACTGDFPTTEQLSDAFHQSDPSFYDEAVIDLSRSDIVAKPHGKKKLLTPSPLLGAPFAECD